MKEKFMWINGRLQKVKEIKSKNELTRKQEIMLKSELLNLLREKPQKVSRIRKHFLESKKLDIKSNVFAAILSDLKKQKLVDNKPAHRKIWFLNDSDYAKQLIKPIGEDVADELADFFDLEKIDKKFAKQLIEKPKRC